MRFVAIDLGATFIKSALVDAGRVTISHVKRVPFSPFVKRLPPAYREVDPRAVVRIAKQQIDRVLALAPDCAGIVSCSQMHGLVLTDGHGAALTNFISWMDERALRPHPAGKGSVLEALWSRLPSRHGAAVRREIKPGSTASLLYWLAVTQGLPRNAVPSSLPDFVMSQLAHAGMQCEPTMASGFGVFDPRRATWHREAIERLGLGHLRWPELVPYRRVVGTYQHGARRIPVYVPLGDQQCALLGARLQPGELSLNIATGSQVSCLSDRCRRGGYEVRPFFDGMFLNTVTRLPAGRALNALMDLLGEFGRSQRRSLKDPWRYVEGAAARVKSTDLRVDLNFFSGWQTAGGGIANIRDSNLTAGQLFRAAFERMADNYYAAARQLDPQAAWKRLVLSGGLIIQSALLQQLVRKRFGLAARVSTTQDDTLRGLLMVSVVLSGDAKTVFDAMERVSASARKRPRPTFLLTTPRS